MEAGSSSTVIIPGALNAPGVDFIKSSHNNSTMHNGLDLLIPKVRTESAKKGCFYSGAQAFTYLPPH